MRKVTEDSKMLTQAKAEKYFDTTKKMARGIKSKSKFRNVILKELKRCVENGYKNENGLLALGNLSLIDIGREWQIVSSDSKSTYYVVRFEKRFESKPGGWACTCKNFLTYQNALVKPGVCKHISKLQNKVGV